MSGPVAPEDAPATPPPAPAGAAGVEVAESRPATVGGLPVRRALPRRERRTVGAWCFLDHFGPAPTDRSSSDGRFGEVASGLARIPAPPPPWATGD